MVVLSPLVAPRDLDFEGDRKPAQLAHTVCPLPADWATGVLFYQGEGFKPTRISKITLNDKTYPVLVVYGKVNDTEQRAVVYSDPWGLLLWLHSQVLGIDTSRVLARKFTFEGSKDNTILELVTRCETALTAVPSPKLDRLAVKDVIAEHQFIIMVCTRSMSMRELWGLYELMEGNHELSSHVGPTLVANTPGAFITHAGEFLIGRLQQSSGALSSDRPDQVLGFFSAAEREVGKERFLTAAMTVFCLLGKNPGTWDVTANKYAKAKEWVTARMKAFYSAAKLGELINIVVPSDLIQKRVVDSYEVSLGLREAVLEVILWGCKQDGTSGKFFEQARLMCEYSGMKFVMWAEEFIREDTSCVWYLPDVAKKARDFTKAFTEVNQKLGPNFPYARILAKPEMDLLNQKKHKLIYGIVSIAKIDKAPTGATVKDMKTSTAIDLGAMKEAYSRALGTPAPRDVISVEEVKEEDQAFFTTKGMATKLPAGYLRNY